MDKFVIRKRKVVEKEAEANTTTHTTSAFPCPCPDNDRERSNLNEEDTESVVLVASTEKEQLQLLQQRSIEGHFSQPGRKTGLGYATIKTSVALPAMCAVKLPLLIYSLSV